MGFASRKSDSLVLSISGVGRGRGPHTVLTAFGEFEGAVRFIEEGLTEDSGGRGENGKLRHEEKK